MRNGALPSFLQWTPSGTLFTTFHLFRLCWIPKTVNNLYSLGSHELYQTSFWQILVKCACRIQGPIWHLWRRFSRDCWWLRKLTFLILMQASNWSNSALESASRGSFLASNSPKCNDVMMSLPTLWKNSGAAKTLEVRSLQCATSGFDRNSWCWRRKFPLQSPRAQILFLSRHLPSSPI